MKVQQNPNYEKIWILDYVNILGHQHYYKLNISRLSNGNHENFVHS